MVVVNESSVKQSVWEGGNQCQKHGPVRKSKNGRRTFGFVQHPAVVEGAWSFRSLVLNECDVRTINRVEFRKKESKKATRYCEAEKRREKKRMVDGPQTTSMTMPIRLPFLPSHPCVCTHVHPSPPVFFCGRSRHRENLALWGRL
jgi:hypothetical protein